jgi:aryl-alcohol dehydrogenase-like predicted oxidoreductase
MGPQRTGRHAPDPAPLTPAPPASPTSAATAAGTRRYAARLERALAADFYRPLAAPSGCEGITVASLGLGTYLGACTDEDDARYEAAVVRALASGSNLLDTAINYRCQRSERAVGRALARAIADGVVRRDEVVVCTKGGFVPLDGAPPPTRAAYDAYLEREFFARGVMTPADVAHGGHSLAPSFLRDQVARSRANLGLETIDLYYLHNPEQQLDVLAPDDFRAALRRAFETLEECVARGVVARYGVSTWRALRVAPAARGHLALADLVALAREVAGDAHHLAAVQLPVSLAMPEAVREPTQPIPGRPASRRPATLLQAAHDLGVGVVASAPLMQAQLARPLPAALRGALPACDTDAQRALEFVRRMPGVTAALVGMRSAAHVDENLRAAARTT